MAYIETRDFGGIAGGWLVAIYETLERSAASLRRSAELSRARRALHELPDYLLKDMGIRRSDIDNVIRNGR